ncbi:MAG: recombinase family protein [Crenarchaeota archaeon]|nr:recombinase family protein [Thermoproteota archaeon]
MKKVILRVVGYCRVSTENQKEDGTIEIQVNAIKEYGIKNSLEIVQVFRDEGVSGSLSNRPGLSAMFDFIEQNKIDAVVIWKLDRIARDLYIQEMILKKLADANVRILSLKENDLDSKEPMRVAFRQMVGIMSQLERAFITMRLSEGRKNKAKKGGYAGGCRPYGYSTFEGKLLIDTEQAEIVREIHKLRRNNHYSFRQIAKDLNDRGIPTQRGREWKAGTIHAILKNTKYRGVFKYTNEVASRPDLALI